jgi:hypothetical protein
VIFVITLLLTLVLVVFVFPAYTSQFPEGAGLIDIKNAWNKQNMDRVVGIWEENDAIDYVAMMFWVHMLDLFFMPIYGMAVFSGLILVARGMRSGGKAQRFFLWASVSAWVAVGFDLVEEIHILVMLADISTITEFNAFGASLSAFVCVLLLYSALFLLMTGGLFSLIIHSKNRGRF